MGKSQQQDGDRDVPEVVEKLEERRRRYSRRSLAFRVVWTTTGFIVLAAGIAMTVFPGPAIIVIPTGLAMLSFEFTWAERLLDFALKRGLDAKEYATRVARRRKGPVIASGIFLLFAIGAGITLYFTGHK
jgi:uncharacterized protein (TIGR02611 family)